ncbi:MAG: hypothetical protein WBA45_06060 [Microthrixaceae bacterium]
MTTIRIDPNELVTAASALRSTAAELAEVGSQLTSCVQCPMPPSTQAEVATFVSTLDAIYDRIAVILNSWANDLGNRAAVAANDMATGASIGATPLASSITTTTMGMGFIGGGSSGFTVVDPNSGQAIDPTTLYGGMATIGGHSSPTITIIDPTTGLQVDPNTLTSGMATIGGASAGSRSYDNPAMILAQAAQTHRDRATAIGNRILANPSSSQSDIMAVYGSQISMNDSITRNLAPSRSDMERKVGYTLTLGQYYDMVPEARP